MALQLASPDASTALKTVEYLARQGTDNCADIVHAGCLPRLVALLAPELEAPLQRSAATALGHVMHHATLHSEVIASGAMPHLWELLSSANKGVQSAAAYAVCALLPAIVRRLACGLDLDNEEAAAIAARLARCSEEARDAMVAAHALRPLAALLTGGSPAAQERACVTLMRLADGSDARRNAIIESGALPQLRSLLSIHMPDPLRQAAAAVAAALAGGGSEMACDALIEADFLPPLFSILATGSEGAAVEAAYALGDLAIGSSGRCDAIVEAGGLVHLVEALNSDSQRVQGLAAWVVNQLVSEVGGAPGKDILRHAAVVESGAIEQLIALISEYRMSEDAEDAAGEEDAAEERVARAVTGGLSAAEYAVVWALRALTVLAAGLQCPAVLKAGALPPLAGILRDGGDCAKEGAVGLVKALMRECHDDWRDAAVAAKILPPLAALLSGATLECREGAALAIRRIAAGVENVAQRRRRVIEAGAANVIE